LNAATFAVSALLLVRIPGSRLQEGRAPSRGHLRDLADGFALVRRSRPLALVFWTWNLGMFACGAVNVAEIALAKESFHAGSFGFGLMWAASGVGLFLGSMYASSWLARRGISVVYGSALAVMGLAWAAAAVSPSVWVAVWFLAAGGVGNGAAVVYNSLLVQRGAPDHLRGRVFT